MNGKMYAVTHDHVIDRPAYAIWPHMLEYHQWNPEHRGARVERVRGNRNEAGEVIIERKRNGDGFAAPVLIETVAVIPNRKIVWALYSPEHGPSKGVAFVDFTLQHMGGVSVLIYNLYGWRDVAEALNQADTATIQQDVIARLNKIFAAFKEYVEARVPATGSFIRTEREVTGEGSHQ